MPANQLLRLRKNTVKKALDIHSRRLAAGPVRDRQPARSRPPRISVRPAAVHPQIPHGPRRVHARHRRRLRRRGAVVAMTTASPPVENTAYAAFARRILRAYARRISAGDIDALADITILAADIDNAIRHAVTGLREHRLLLGRDRRPARRHPPGRAAALGRHPAMTVRNTALKSGAHITWTQYRTADARYDGRERTGWFWALAPGRNAIWVRPDPPEPGEPVAIKVYRTVRSAGAYTETVAYDDDLTADTP